MYFYRIYSLQTNTYIYIHPRNITKTEHITLTTVFSQRNRSKVTYSVQPEGKDMMRLKAKIQIINLEI